LLYRNHREISDLQNRRRCRAPEVPIGELVENKRAAETAAAKEKNLSSEATTTNAQNTLIKRLDVLSDEVSSPTWSDIEAAIQRLDGSGCTLVSLGIGDPVPHMAIGGGKQDKYILYATFDNAVFYTLADPANGPGQAEMIAGSQAGLYKLRNCVSWNLVLRAAKTFSETGKLDSQLTWDRR
jgi:hypothetical protein